MAQKIGKAGRNPAPTPLEQRKWLSVPQAAVYMSLSRNTVRRLVWSSAVPSYRPSPGRVVLMRTELDRYMDGHRTMSSEEMLAMAEQKLLEMEMRRRSR